MITLLLIKLKGKEYVIFLYASILFFIIFSFFFGFIRSFILYICLFILLKIYSLFKIKNNNLFDIYFGVPGCGKSTLATDYAIKYLKKGGKVFTMNIDIPGATSLNKNDLSCNNFELRDSLLIIDESGIDFNNRNFKTNFDNDTLKFFKYHRHFNVDVMVFSQSYSDMDLKLRNLATRLFVLKRSLIPFFIVSKTISKRIDIDSNTKQIIDSYSFLFLSSRYVYMPKTWKYFNSFSE